MLKYKKKRKESEGRWQRCGAVVTTSTGGSYRGGRPERALELGRNSP